MGGTLSVKSDYEMNVLHVLNIHNAFLTHSGWLFKYILYSQYGKHLDGNLRVFFKPTFYYLKMVLLLLLLLSLLQDLVKKVQHLEKRSLFRHNIWGNYRTVVDIIFKTVATSFSFQM